MDLGSYLFSVCVALICCSNGEDISCPCPEISPVNLAQPPPKTCFQIKGTFRYTCKPRYVRKAGTSNLIRCKQINGVVQWTPHSLQCIPDPKITTTQPPKTTGTKGYTGFTNDSIVTTTITASTSLQMTQSATMSVSVTADRQSAEPTSPGQWVPSNSSQAASTSLQMTQSATMSVSVTADRQSAEPTSPGQWVLSDPSQDIVKEVSAGHRPRSTSTTTEPPNNSTVNFSVSDLELSSKTLVLSTIALLVIICAFIGFSFLFYKRRSNHNMAQPTAEEQIPMNDVASALATGSALAL